MSQFEEVKAIASDADGTLVDTVSLIRHGQHETAVTFLEHHGVPSDDIPSYEDYEVLLNQLVGGSARQTLERTVRALYEDKTHHLDGMDFDELNNLLDPIQDRIAPEHIKAYPGLAQFLSFVGESGIKFGIFTSGTPHHVVRNFGIALGDSIGDYQSLYKDKSVSDGEKLDLFTQRLEDVFHIPQLIVVTCDDVPSGETKPHPRTIQLAMERLGVKPENTLALGDHAVDMQTAANADVANRVGITHGFDDRPALVSAGATRAVDSLGELQTLIAI